MGILSVASGIQTIEGTVLITSLVSLIKRVVIYYFIDQPVTSGGSGW